MPTVFISYSRKNGDYANAFQEATVRAGLSAFLDTRSMEPGEDFMRQTYRAMKRCQVFVLLWSAQAHESKYVFVEWNQAINSRKRIIPVRLDTTPLPGPLSNIQAMMVGAPEGMNRVALEVKRWRDKQRKRRVILVAISILLAGICLLAGNWLRGNPFQKPRIVGAATSGKVACHKGKVLDHEGRAMAGIEVTIPNMTSSQCDITDENGEFQLCLKGVSMRSKPQFKASLYGREIPHVFGVTGSGGEVTLHITPPDAKPEPASIPEFARISGLLMDRCGNPLVGARVEVLGLKHGAASVKSEANGRFMLRFESSAQGLDSVPILITTSAGQQSRHTIPIDLDQRIKDLPCPQRPATGKTLALNVRSNIGAPVAGAKVRLLRDGVPMPGWDTLRTDENGTVLVIVDSLPAWPDAWDACCPNQKEPQRLKKKYQPSSNIYLKRP